jgi:hypothetical protein
MLTTTRLCALFICLLRQCIARAYAGGNNSKKIIMITIFFFSLFSFVLHPKRLLSDYLKYLRASQHKIPSVTSRVFFFSCSRASKRTSTITNCSFSLSLIFSMFEIMRQMFDCRAWIFFAEKVSKWNRVSERHNVIVRVIQLSMITSTLRSIFSDRIYSFAHKTTFIHSSILFQVDKRHGYFHVCYRAGGIHIRIHIYI